MLATVGSIRSRQYHLTSLEFPLVVESRGVNFSSQCLPRRSLLLRDAAWGFGCYSRYVFDGEFFCFEFY